MEVMAVGQKPEQVKKDFDCAHSFDGDGEGMRDPCLSADGDGEVEVCEAN